MIVKNYLTVNKIIMKKLLFLICFCSLSVVLGQTDTPNTNPKNWGDPVFEENFDNLKTFQNNWLNALKEKRWPQQQRFVQNRANLGKHNKLELSVKLNADPAIKNDRQVTAPITSGEVISKEKFLYGYIEARIKLPKGEGVFPAFWLFDKDWQLDTDYPREIDIIEQRTGINPDNGEVVYLNTFNHFWENKKYFKRPKKESRAKIALDYNTINYEGWHLIGFEWSKTTLKWYINDYLVSEIKNKNIDKIANTPLNIFLSLQLLYEGTFLKYNVPAFDKETVESQTMKVDWVKVWKRKQLKK